jgi:ArsR family transcriptional regulator
VVQTSQPSASRHLKQLGRQGWVLRRKVGTSTWYRMEPARLDPQQQAIWALVGAALDEEAPDATSVVAADDRRLDTVLSQRDGDAAEMFRRLGSRWDEVRREQFGTNYLLPTVLGLLPEGQVVVDLGCGTGGLLATLAPAVRTAVGVDRERAMLQAAEERLAHQLSKQDAARVRLVEGLLGALPLETDSVDCALCMLVLHHVRDPAPVFAEVRRVLRSGGRFVLLDMVAHDREEFRRTMGHQHRGFSEEQLTQWARGAGLGVARLTALPPDPAAQGPGLFVAVLTAP